MQSRGDGDRLLNLSTLNLQESSPPICLAVKPRKIGCEFLTFAQRSVKNYLNVIRMIRPTKVNEW